MRTTVRPRCQNASRGALNVLSRRRPPRGSRAPPTEAAAVSRRDWLLLLLAFEGAPDGLHPVRVQKSLFLLAHDAELGLDPDEAYEFAPYNYGPMSKQVYADLDELEADGLIRRVPGRRAELDAVPRLPSGLTAATAADRRHAPEDVPVARRLFEIKQLVVGQDVRRARRVRLRALPRLRVPVDLPPPAHLTLVLALRCREGAVLAADDQLTYRAPRGRACARRRSPSSCTHAESPGGGAGSGRPAALRDQMYEDVQLTSRTRSMVQDGIEAAVRTSPAQLKPTRRSTC